MRVRHGKAINIFYETQGIYKYKKHVIVVPSKTESCTKDTGAIPCLARLNQFPM